MQTNRIDISRLSSDAYASDVYSKVMKGKEGGATHNNTSKNDINLMEMTLLQQLNCHDETQRELLVESEFNEVDRLASPHIISLLDKRLALIR